MLCDLGGATSIIVHLQTFFRRLIGAQTMGSEYKPSLAEPSYSCGAIFAENQPSGTDVASLDLDQGRSLNAGVEDLLRKEMRCLLKKPCGRFT